MQDSRDGTPPPPSTFAVILYLSVLRKIRSLNTLVNQQVSADEFMEQLKKALKEKVSMEKFFQQIEQEKVERFNLLWELILQCLQAIKFAQENPLVMMVGIDPKGLDVIQEKHKKELEQLEENIKELEKNVMMLASRYNEITRKMELLEREIARADLACFDAALNLFLPVNDPNQSIKVDVSKFASLQEYLPRDKEVHTIEIRHHKIKERVSRKVQENPKNIDIIRIKDFTKQAIHEEFIEQSHSNFVHLSMSKLEKILIKDGPEIQEIFSQVEPGFDPKQLKIITENSQMRSQAKEEYVKLDEERTVTSQRMQEEIGKLEVARSMKDAALLGHDMTLGHPRFEVDEPVIVSSVDHRIASPVTELFGEEERNDIHQAPLRADEKSKSDGTSKTQLHDATSSAAEPGAQKNEKEKNSVETKEDHIKETLIRQVPVVQSVATEMNKSDIQPKGIIHDKPITTTGMIMNNLLADAPNVQNSAAPKKRTKKSSKYEDAVTYTENKQENAQVGKPSVGQAEQGASGVTLKSHQDKQPEAPKKDKAKNDNIISDEDKKLENHDADVTRRRGSAPM